MIFSYVFLVLGQPEKFRVKLVLGWCNALLLVYIFDGCKSTKAWTHDMAYGTTRRVPPPMNSKLWSFFFFLDQDRIDYFQMIVS